MLIGTLSRFPALAKDYEVIGIADKLVTSTLQFLIQFVQYNITQNRTERTALRYTKLTWFIVSAMDYSCIQIAVYQRNDTTIRDGV